MDTQKNNEENIDLSNMFNNPVEKPKDDEEEKLQDPEQIFSPSTPKMVKWLIKHSWGLIKTEKVANFILLILAVIMFAASFVLLYGQLAPKTASNTEFIDMAVPPMPN